MATYYKLVHVANGSFFVGVVSDSRHWLFAGSTVLTMGKSVRIKPVFLYVSVADKLYEIPYTGLTIIRLSVKQKACFGNLIIEEHDDRYHCRLAFVLKTLLRLFVLCFEEIKID